MNPKSETFLNSAPVPTPSKASRRVGLGLGGIALLFLTFDIVIKLMQSPEALAGTEELGYPATVVLPLGILQIVLLALYLYPRTSILGAVLWTGYLGGAIATHVRLENPLFTHILFPIYVAIFLWGALWLRDPRLRTLIPFDRGR